MNTKKMKGALSRSLEAETEAIQKRNTQEDAADRFRKADAFFDEPSLPQPPPVPEAKGQVRTQVRDSFTFPAEDHELIQKIVTRCLQNGVGVNKSETLRAALHVLHSLSDADILEAVSKLERIKTGRPSRSS